MEVLGLRWGREELQGSYVVELRVKGEDQHNYAIACVRGHRFEHIYIAPIPLFDLILDAGYYGVDVEMEYEKIQDHTIEEYLGTRNENYLESRNSMYEKAITLTQNALTDYEKLLEAGEKNLSAKKYIEPYLGENLNRILHFPGSVAMA